MSDEVKTAGGDKVEEAVKVSRKRAHEDDVSDTESNDSLMKLPQKKFYRQRAHVNPLAFNPQGSHYRPVNPESMPWNDHFGPSFQNKPVKNVDVGCGYGGLLFKMSEIYADECSIGMEIREKVSRFVQDKIKALRHNEPGKYENISCFRTNAMRYLANFFVKAQLQRMFFLFPDPHFKKKKEKWRIISVPLLSEYAYFINSGGFIYTVTDVLQYHEWVLECFAATKLFEKVDEEELKQDPIFPYIFGVSEEGQKVTRNNGDKYHAIYRRTNVESTFEPDLNKQEDIAGAGVEQEDEEGENDEDQEDQSKE